jgi:hypothetical protein
MIGGIGIFPSGEYSSWAVRSDIVISDGSKRKTVEWMSHLCADGKRVGF